MTVCKLLLAAEGGPRWPRLIGIVVVCVAVLLVRTVLVRLLARKDG